MNLKQRICRDARRLAGDAEAMALLECLAKHLFDSRLDATLLGKVCAAPRRVRDRLAAEVGPLKPYVTELRMIEAARLVRETDLPMKQIARNLGYEVPRTFRRAFCEQHRMTPAEMRRQARAEQSGSPDPASAAQSSLDASREQVTPRAKAKRLRRRVDLGLLDDPRAGELRARLRRRYPELEDATRCEAPGTGAPGTGAPSTGAPGKGAPGEETPEPVLDPVILRSTGDFLEPFAAAAVFGCILTLPETELRHAMLNGVRLGSPASFEVLRELCFGQSQWNPERAVAVAELGVQLLELQRGDLGAQADAWKAAAWAFLGRVQMLVGDFAAAERAIGFAWEEIEEGSETFPRKGTHGTPPWVEIEIRQVEGMLRMRQGRGGEAAAALDRALELGRGLAGEDPAHTQSVVERLELATLMGEIERTLELCNELEGLVEMGAAGLERVEQQRALVAYHRGKAYAAAGRDDVAEQLWRQAGQHVEADQAVTEPPGAAVFETAVLGSFLTHELARLAGRHYRNLEVYEILLRQAIDRYKLVRVPMFEVAAEAELAALCALRGQAAEARSLASSAADFLDRLPSHRQAWAAAARLRALVNGGTEVEESALSDVLAGLCDDLDSVRWEITGAQASPAAQARRERS